MVGEIFHYRVISSDRKTDTCTLWYKKRRIDSEVGTSCMEYIEGSREDPDIIENVKHQTVKDGFNL